MVSTKSRKYEVILDRCAVIDAATAVFRFDIATFAELALLNSLVELGGLAAVLGRGSAF